MKTEEIEVKCVVLAAGIGQLVSDYQNETRTVVEDIEIEQMFVDERPMPVISAVNIKLQKAKIEADIKIY